MNKYKKTTDAVIPEDLEDYLRIGENRTDEDEHRLANQTSNLF